MDTQEEYNQDEELEIAEIMRNKAETLAEEQGLSYDEVKQKGQLAFDKARRKYALEFLKKLEKKLSELGNQEVAQILLALINSGLPIETEEELEYWINRLERESLQRVAMYFMARNEGSLKISPNHKKKLMKNIKDFTSEDIAAFGSMMSSVNHIMEKKIPHNKDSIEYKKYLEKAKFFKEVEKIIKKDAQEKKKEEKNNSQKKSRKPNEPDYLAALKNKMTAQGVEAGGAYWENVVGNYTTASEKGKFVEQWQKDETLQKALDKPEKDTQQQIKELRGIDNIEKRISSENKSRVNQNVQQNTRSNSGRSSGR